MGGNFKETWEILAAVLEENADPTKNALRVVGQDSNVIDSGKATAGTTGALTDSGKSWPVNFLAGMYLKITDGTNKGAMRIIASNTATVITITGTFAAAIDATSEYEIINVASLGTAVSVADGADVTQGAKADAKSAATDTTPVTIMQVLKQISYSVQNPPAISGSVSVSNMIPAVETGLAKDASFATLLTGIVGATAKTLFDVWTALTGILKVGGDVAAATADSGNPVKIGAKFNSTNPTYLDGQRCDLQADVRGILKVTGGVAAQTTDSGNPLKIGGKYNITPPTLTDGQRGDAQLSASGQLLVSQGVQAGEDFTDDSVNVNSNKRVMTVYNVAMTTGGTEYSQALPALCKGFKLKCRGANDVKITMAAGASGTTYFTVASGTVYEENSAKLSSKTLYFQCAASSQVLEIIAWS